MRSRILIVEDERIIALEIKNFLHTLGYDVIGSCSTEDEAYRMATSKELDLVLMDIYLAQGDGINATKRIKADNPHLPVVFLSGYMDEETISRAIAVEPESYLLKPFNRAELHIAIRMALVSRNVAKIPVQHGGRVLDDEFEFDTAASQLLYYGETVSLTKKERALLTLFVSRPNILISIDQIEYELWPDKPSNPSRRRSLISRLRAKLKHKFIQTHASEGYLFKI